MPFFSLSLSLSFPYHVPQFKQNVMMIFSMTVLSGTLTEVSFTVKLRLTVQTVE